MKASFPPLVCAVLLLLAASPAFAGLESLQLHSDNDLPRFPALLIAEGVTRGYTVVAVGVDEEGRPDDLLVIGHSHERLARATVEALRRWRFVPARLDGRPVRAQTELRFDYTVEGVVLSGNITDFYLAELAGRADGYRLAYRPCPPAQLDRPLTKLAGEAPHYAAAAEKDGVRGSVEVHFYIDEQGAVRLPCVTAGTHPYLGEQAVEALKSWKFSPPTSHGRPVLVAAAQTFDFGSGK